MASRGMRRVRPGASGLDVGALRIAQAIRSRPSTTERKAGSGRGRVPATRVTAVLSRCRAASRPSPLACRCQGTRRRVPPAALYATTPMIGLSNNNLACGRGWHTVSTLRRREEIEHERVL